MQPLPIYNVNFDNEKKTFDSLDLAINYVVPKLGDISIICLYGELGAGKTYFTQKFLKVVGVKKNVTSPTFVIMNEYQIKYKSFERIVRHIDVYRVNAEQFLQIIPHDELIDDSFLYIIEWPENIDEILPKEKRIDIYITIGNLAD